MMELELEKRPYTSVKPGLNLLLELLTSTSSNSSSIISILH